jgi:hypothetical protein
MAVSRYRRTDILDLGRQFGTGRAHEVIRAAIKAGTLSFQAITLREGQRLDHLAGIYYGNGRYAWIIAAASDIGWMLQVPPGTYIRIPDLEQSLRLVG